MYTLRKQRSFCCFIRFQYSVPIPNPNPLYMQTIHIERYFVDYHNKNSYYCDLLYIIELKSMRFVLCFGLFILTFAPKAGL